MFLRVVENGFLRIKCTTCQCNVCTFSPVYDLSCFKDQGVVKLYHFVVEEYKLSKKGEMKSGKQTTKKNFHEPIQEFITKFDSIFCINFKLRMIFYIGPRSNVTLTWDTCFTRSVQKTSASLKHSKVWTSGCTFLIKADITALYCGLCS